MLRAALSRSGTHAIPYAIAPRRAFPSMTDRLTDLGPSSARSLRAPPLAGDGSGRPVLHRRRLLVALQRPRLVPGTRPRLAPCPRSLPIAAVAAAIASIRGV